MTRSTNLTNSGTAARSLSITLNGSADFTLASASSASVAPCATVPVSVTYTPSAAVLATDTLPIAHNDPTKPSMVVDLKGFGTAPPPPSTGVKLDISGQSNASRSATVVGVKNSRQVYPAVAVHRGGGAPAPPLFLALTASLPRRYTIQCELQDPAGRLDNFFPTAPPSSQHLGNPRGNSPLKVLNTNA
jgi:hypothetical protein